MHGAVREQVVHELGVALAKAGRPPDDLELVAITGTDRVGPMLDEQPDDPQVAALNGKVERHGVVAFVTDVRIGTTSEQGLDDVEVMHAKVEGGSQSRVAGKRAAIADDAGMGIGHRGNCCCVAFAGGHEQVRQRRGWCAEGTCGYS